MAASITASSLPASAAYKIWPLRSNMKLTAPVSAMFPPCLPNSERTLPAVRFRLSVITSTIIATPPGP